MSNTCKQSRHFTNTAYNKRQTTLGRLVYPKHLLRHEIRVPEPCYAIARMQHLVGT
jgi:hypothetical protein